jgi:Domain of Unknown Function (DUF748)
MNLPDRLLTALRHRWVVRGVLTLVALIALFGLFGYLALPGIIKSQAEKAVSAALHRSFTIERVDVRPFALEVSIHGAALREPDGKGVFASVQDLEVRISTASLVHLAPVVKELHIVAPTVHLARTGPNRYNTDDIVAALAAQASASPKAKAPVRSQGARFSVYNIRIDGGQVDFDDQPAHARHTVTDLKIGVPFVSSLPSNEEVFVEPLLSAVINGAPLLIKGKALPFAQTREALVDLDLDRVDLPRYLQYLPFEPRFAMPSAQLDLHVHASFQQPQDRPAALILSGKATLRSLQLNTTAGDPLLSLPQLEVELGKADVFGGRFEVSRVAATGLNLNLVRDARGVLNLAQLAPPEQPDSSPQTASASAAQGAAPAARKGAIQVVLGQIALQGAALRFTDRDPQRPLAASLEQFDLRISDAALDLAHRQLAIGRIDSGGARFQLQQGRTESEHPDAGVQATSPAAAPPAGVVAPPPSAPATASEPWTASVGRVSIGNWAARIESRGLPQLAVTTVSAISVSAENLSNARATAAGKVELKAQVNRKGSLSVAGAVGISPIHADLALDLKGVDLLPIQPYITAQINLLITQAELSSRGRLTLDQAPDGSLKGGFRGDVTLGNLATIDKLNASDFLNWKSLFFGGVDARLAPLSLNIDQIALNNFFARVIIDPSGRINLQDVMRTAPSERRSLTTAQPQVAAAPVPKPPASAAAEPSASFPIKIRELKLEAGSVRYTDNFIKPNYTANLVDLGGTVSGLSSAADSSAAVDVRGQVNSAPLTIEGRINPIRGDLFVDLKAGVHGMELAPLSPYSGKYVGYGIERGKLSFDVAYKLEHRQLSAENRLVLDQLTFGEKVESPDATTLPVRFAISLLKDRNGVIDLNLPIGGSLDDPQFSIGGVIVKVIVNLVSKAVTAPFAMLGSLFGGGEELSFVEFDPGQVEVGPAGQARLQALAKALIERPGLTLEIAASVDPVADREGLRTRSLDRRVRALKVQDLVAKGESATVAEVTVSPQEYPLLLARVYEAQIGPKPRKASGTQPPPAPAEMEKLLLAGTAISDDDLTALGNRRSQSVKTWLQTVGQVPEQRLFLTATKLGAEADADHPSQAAAKTGRVQFSLK